MVGNNFHIIKLSLVSNNNAEIVCWWPDVHKNSYLIIFLSALLMPSDHTTDYCKNNLARTSKIKHHTSLREGRLGKRAQCKKHVFGHQYKEITGHQKAVLLKLPTGECKIQSKTDCWLTYKEYLKLTK